MDSVISHMLLAYGLTIIVSMSVALMIKGMTVAMASGGGSNSAPVVAANAQPAAPSATSATAADDIAAIAAAVYAMLGAQHYRIVHIRDQGGTMWTAGGRMMNQTSHNIPRRTHTPGN
ncbi:MAG: hypothetical protein H7840_07625 [Alphaproteobacteria bacterium]